MLEIAARKIRFLLLTTTVALYLFTSLLFSSISYAAPSNYDRNSAVKWAIEHAQDTPPFDSSCVQFVSQSLWTGGITETTTWNSGHFDNQAYSLKNKSQTRAGTPAAWNVERFKEYITDTFQNSEIHLLNLQDNSIPDAQVGDVILYDWNGDDTADHAALIVNIAEGYYPEVAEWGALDGATATPYQKRGWTWSEFGSDWLQNTKDSKDVKAELLKIDVE